MSAYDGYATYGRVYGMTYPPASPASHYHVAGLQSAAAVAAAAAAGSGATGTGSGPTPKAYNGLCLTGTGVDLLHPAMVYPGTVSFPARMRQTNFLLSRRCEIES